MKNEKELKATVAYFPMPAGGFSLYGMTPVEFTKHLLKQMGMTSVLVTGDTSLNPGNPILCLDEWIEVYWAENGIKEITIAGEKKFPGYYYGHVVHTPATWEQPEEYDFHQVGETRSILTAIRWAICKWVEHTIDQLMESESERAYARERAEEE